MAAPEVTCHWLGGHDAKAVRWHSGNGSACAARQGDQVELLAPSRAARNR
jgi:hypothetical protein